MSLKHIHAHMCTHAHTYTNMSEVWNIECLSMCLYGVSDGVGELEEALFPLGNLAQGQGEVI